MRVLPEARAILRQWHATRPRISMQVVRLLRSREPTEVGDVDIQPSVLTIRRRRQHPTHPRIDHSGQSRAVHQADHELGLPDVVRSGHEIPSRPPPEVDVVVLSVRVREQWIVGTARERLVDGLDHSVGIVRRLVGVVVPPDRPQAVGEELQRDGRAERLDVDLVPEGFELGGESYPFESRTVPARRIVSSEWATSRISA